MGPNPDDVKFKPVPDVRNVLPIISRRSNSKLRYDHDLDHVAGSNSVAMGKANQVPWEWLPWSLNVGRGLIDFWVCPASRIFFRDFPPLSIVLWHKGNESVGNSAGTCWISHACRLTGIAASLNLATLWINYIKSRKNPRKILSAILHKNTKNGHWLYDPFSWNSLPIAFCKLNKFYKIS